MSHNHLTILVFCQVLFLTYLTVSSKNIPGDNTISGSLDPKFPLTLQYVGQADGKSFFVDISLMQKRTDAAAYCQAAKLKQATVDSTSQVNLLRQNLPEFGSTRARYWTSARESRKDTMFVWDDNSTPLNSSMAGGWWMTSGERYCVMLAVDVANNSVSSLLAATLCESLNHPLCHT